jgi:glycosyltransferase involved in cell wall biosynthesis
VRIGLNLMFVASGVAGGRVYAQGLLRGLAAVDEVHEYVLYTRRGLHLPDLPGERFHQVCSPVGTASAVWRTLWEYGRLPRLVRTNGIDLWHGLGSISPASSCPFILTIHDLIHLRYPQSLPLGHRYFTRWFQPSLARRADRILVPSRATAQDVIERLGVRKECVRLIPYGPGNGFGPVPPGNARDAVLVRYGIRPPYVLSVARGYPHKNLEGLLRAFARLRARERAAVQLVLIGEAYRVGEGLGRLAQELRIAGVVAFTGFIPNADLNALYSAASVFAFPSLAEGFGLPVLEAMACGVPVVASRASAVPEAVGDAGVLADATDADEFSQAMLRVLDDEALRADLRERGLRRVAEFRWEETARKTLAVYAELGQGHPL